MADLTITAGSVLSAAGSKVVDGVAGVALTAGQVVYLDSATSTYKLADCNSGTAAARSPAGIALHAAAAGQPIAVHVAGRLTIGATLAQGVYLLSATPGGIAPHADLTTGWYGAIVGIAVSSSVLDVRLHEAGATF